MTISLQPSIRAATQIYGADEVALERIQYISCLARIENAFRGNPDAQETFACA